MQRREFITLLGGAAAAWPLAARAQQPALPVIGFLHPASPAGYVPYVTGFRRGLSESGFVEGRNVAIEFRWAEDQNDRLPAMAAELLQRRVAVIVAGSTDAAVAVKSMDPTIPIIFSTGIDPVTAGLVMSFNRPGGNATGIVQFSNELIAKRLEMLREMVPNAAIIGLLVDPSNGVTESRTAAVQSAARVIGQQIRVLRVTGQEQFDAAFATMVQEQVGALLVPNSPLFTNNRDRLVALAARYAVPAAYEFRAFALAGGLFSYGSSLADAYQLVGGYTGRILKGEKPADMPVVQPTRFEFVLNLKTAKALNLDIPLKLHAFADEVIE